jgi:hypothetical protein
MKSIHFRRQFFDSIKNKLGIKNPEDWGKVRVSSISEFGGLSLIKNYYNGSLFECLRSVYSGKKLFFFLKCKYFRNRLEKRMVSKVEQFSQIALEIERKQKEIY